LPLVTSLMRFMGVCLGQESPSLERVSHHPISLSLLCPLSLPLSLSPSLLTSHGLFKSAFVIAAASLPGNFASLYILDRFGRCVTSIPPLASCRCHCFHSHTLSTAGLLLHLHRGESIQCSNSSVLLLPVCVSLMNFLPAALSLSLSLSLLCCVLCIQKAGAVPEHDCLWGVRHDVCSG
jgi:hypothetical protein